MSRRWHGAAVGAWAHRQPRLQRGGQVIPRGASVEVAPHMSNEVAFEAFRGPVFHTPSHLKMRRPRRPQRAFPLRG